jgi:hypothetical protein
LWRFRDKEFTEDSETEGSYGYNDRFHLTSVTMEELFTMTEPLLLQIAPPWLGTGGQYHSAGDMHVVSKASARTAVREVVAAMKRIMLPQWVRWPHNMTEVVRKFHDLGL